MTVAPLMTAREVASLLRVSNKSVYRWANEGLLPCVRLGAGGVGSTVRFRAADVERLAEQGAGR